MDAVARADPAVLERLRERIRTLQAAPRQLLSVLRTGLPGYADYAAKVRWRLVPGIW